MPKYRRKTVVIEAFQMTRERRTNNSEWPEWLHAAWQLERDQPGSLQPTPLGAGTGPVSINTLEVSIMTLEGAHLVGWNDFIIQGLQGEIYPCKPDIFEATYEPAHDD